MFKENVQLSTQVVGSIKKRFSQFKKENPDKEFALIDNEDNIITEINCDGPLIEFKILANDGSEYLKLRSTNDISVKIRNIGLHRH